MSWSNKIPPVEQAILTTLQVKAPRFKIWYEFNQMFYFSIFPSLTFLSLFLTTFLS